jgi:hypothetical protein
MSVPYASSTVPTYLYWVKRPALTSMASQKLPSRTWSTSARTAGSTRLCPLSLFPVRLFVNQTCVVLTLNSRYSPGHPPIWKETTLPFRTQSDVQLNKKGTVFRDQNSYRMPDFPLLPICAAVDDCQASIGRIFDWTNVSFVTDRNGLRKLLRWADHSPKLSDFRIDAELHGQTILLGRYEPRAVVRTDENSYGFAFEHATTLPAPGCEAATGYARIMSYVRASPHELVLRTHWMH